MNAVVQPAAEASVSVGSEPFDDLVATAPVPNERRAANEATNASPPRWIERLAEAMRANAGGSAASSPTRALVRPSGPPPHALPAAGDARAAAGEPRLAAPASPVGTVSASPRSATVRMRRRSPGGAVATRTMAPARSRSASAGCSGRPACRALSAAARVPCRAGTAPPRVPRPELDALVRMAAHARPPQQARGAPARAHARRGDRAGHAPGRRARLPIVHADVPDGTEPVRLPLLAPASATRAAGSTSCTCSSPGGRAALARALDAVAHADPAPTSTSASSPVACRARTSVCSTPRSATTSPRARAVRSGRRWRPSPVSRSERWPRPLWSNAPATHDGRREGDGREPRGTARQGRDARVAATRGLANRHGMIAGATGTGKTVSLQVMAEGLSRLGVPVFMTDVKGDLSGISQPGGEHPKITERTRDDRPPRLRLRGQPDRAVGPRRRARPPDPHDDHRHGPGAARAPSWT